MHTKQVIVIRKDLKMRRGKEIAQCSHASIAFLTRRMQQNGQVSMDDLDESMQKWIESGFAKICVRVNSEEELLMIYQKAKESALEVHLITDSGKTEFNGVPTNTCLAIGPAESSLIDVVTEDLNLY